MKLAQPELKRVWPGAPSLEKPEGEVRLLYDELISYDDVKDAIIESTQVPHGMYSTADLRLFGKALGQLPRALRQWGLATDCGHQSSQPAPEL
jgi:hypothetical protein